METKEEEDMADKKMVKIEQITVDGIVYTCTRPGYYYKKAEDGKQVRIPKAEWDVVWEAEAERERLEREQKQAEADKETEDAVNGKTKKEKKAAKPRRSKDIAYDGNGITLTTKQVDFIKALPSTSFYENGLDSTLWCDCIAQDIEWNPMSVGAMISTLREKDLVVVVRDDSRQGKPKAMNFTELGKQVAKELGLE